MLKATIFCVLFCRSGKYCRNAGSYNLKSHQLWALSTGLLRLQPSTDAEFGD